MYYCEMCNRVHPQPECPSCKNISSRGPTDEDYCLLGSIGFPWSEMLVDLLKDNEISCISEPAKRNGMVAYRGTTAERMQLYVPYAQLEEAHQLQEALMDGALVADEPE